MGTSISLGIASNVCLHGCIFFLALLLAILKAQEDIRVYPLNHVQTISGGNITFTCYTVHGHDVIQNITWRVNGTRVKELNFQELQAEFSSIGNGLGHLTISNVSDHFNETTIQCIATFSSGITLTSNSASILILQDHLQPVTSLAIRSQFSVITLNWEAPYSLTPLTYCVRVSKVSMQTRVLQQCGLTVTSFAYPLPTRSYCDITVFEVYPVNQNNVTGAESVVSHYEAQTSPQVNISSQMVMNSSTYFLTMSAPVCRAELTFLDTDTKETITLGVFDLIIDETNITFTTQQLRQNHRYNITVMASNIFGPSTSQTQLSTHGVKDALIVYEENDISIRVTFCDQAHEMGALIVFISANQSKNFMNSIIFTLNRNTSHNYSLPFKLLPGDYRMLVYDIEQDGTLSTGVGYPAFENTATANADDGQCPSPATTLLPTSETCDIESSSRLILVQCRANFQIVVQLSNSNKIYANKTTDGYQTTVEVKEDGLYQVTVFIIREGRGIVDSNVALKKQLFIIDLPVATSTMAEHVTYFTPFVVVVSIVGPAFILLITTIAILIYCSYKHALYRRYNMKEKVIDISSSNCQETHADDDDENGSVHSHTVTPLQESVEDSTADHRRSTVSEEVGRSADDLSNNVLASRPYFLGHTTRHESSLDIRRPCPVPSMTRGSKSHEQISMFPCDEDKSVVKEADGRRMSQLRFPPAENIDSNIGNILSEWVLRPKQQVSEV